MNPSAAAMFHRQRNRLVFAWSLVWAIAISHTLAADTDVYRIMPGDSLRIAVLNRPEYSQEVKVQRDGTFVYFVVGNVIAAGRTLTELQALLREGLTPKLADAEVVVVPVPRANEVYVGGEVRTPGRYEFAEGEIDVQRAIMLGGGSVPDVADLTRVHVIAVGEEASTVDATLSPDTLVRHGTAIVVAARSSIRVTGNVQTPGVYYVAGPVSVRYALGLAGGPVDEKGSVSDFVVLRRDGSVEPVGGSERFWEGSDSGPTLRSGDTLYVPNAYRVEEISVLGYVHNPGMLRVRGPITVARALSLAGGAILDEADLKSIEVIRARGSVDRLALEETSTESWVYPGDVVRVSKRFTINWMAILSAISTGAVVYSLIRR